MRKINSNILILPSIVVVVLAVIILFFKLGCPKNESQSPLNRTGFTNSNLKEICKSFGLTKYYNDRDSLDMMK